MFKDSATKGWTKKSLSFLSAATRGDAVAQYELGLRLLHGEEVPKNEKLAIDWLFKSAGKGNEDAQYLLGTCYDSGTGVEMDEKKALGFFVKSAEAANKYAQYKLGIYYFAEKNYDVAVDWFKRAARQEHPESQVELARCYYYGFGSIKSEEGAVQALDKAVKRNFKPAIKMLEKIKNGE